MKILNWIPALALSGLMASSALAAPNVIIGSDSIAIGDTATIDLTFQADGVVAGLDFTFTFDDVLFTATPSCVASVPTTGPVAPVVCSVIGNTVKVLVSAPFAFPVPTIVSGDQSLGSISFQSSGTTPVAGYALAITDENYFDIAAAAVTPTASTDGTITVNAGPQPLFAATPASVALSGQISNTIQTNVVIDNNGGDDGSTLTYTCTVPAGKFTLSGDTTNFAVAKGSTGTVTVACDSSAIGGPFNDTMSCTHNGSTSPDTIPLSCTVTAGPEPKYSDALVPDPLTFNVAEEGNADPSGTVTVTNTGDPSTSLTGACTISGDSQLTIAGGAFTLTQNASQVATVSCDASAEGTYNAVVSCAHNAGNVTSPVTHDVSCVVGPPGPAVYLSAPAPGAVIDMTATDVPVGAVVPDQVLTITNDAAEANDREMALMGCAWAGDAAITATAPTTPVAAQASTSVTFSCDTAAVGDYTGTYSCPYDLDGSGTANGTATYTVTCGVRAAASDILEAPVSGTALNILVPIAGTAQTAVNFSEILDEGVDATVDSCSFGTAIFSVVTTMPQTVVAGGTAKIDVSGSDNGSGSVTFTDTLTCTYTDSDSTPGTASWPITLTVLAQPIPTLSTWGLLLMILTLMGLGGIVIRRKVES